MMFPTIHKLLTLLLVFSLLFSCQQKQNQNFSINQESKESAHTDIGDTLDFYFSPSFGATLLELESESFAEYMKQETGFHFNVVIPNSYSELIDSFESEGAELALMNTFGYIKSNELYNSHAKLQAIRYGQSSYYGQIIANTASGISKIEDINGKSIAFTEDNSTSGYLFPKNILEEKEIKPAKVTFGGAHENVVRLVYNGEVDAGATYYSVPGKDGSIRDARARVLKEYPDVADKVKVIEVTEPIPNDPLVFANHLSHDLITKLSDALIKYSQTEHGRQLFNDFYSIEGFVSCTDDSYAGFRKVMGSK